MTEKDVLRAEAIRDDLREQGIIDSSGTHWGKIAMELVAEYPLYGKTSGLTYDEAIAIAKVLYPDVKQWKQIVKEF